jgi:hypothetical protein
MEIITRQQAITAGLRKYFTGEPCKNGHLSERYVQSSTCESCIRSNVPDEANRAQRLSMSHQRAELERDKLALRQQRMKLEQDKFELSKTRVTLRGKAATKRDELIQFRVWLHYADVEFYKSVMLAYAIAIDPTVTIADLMTTRVPHMAGERALHTYRIFQVDQTNLRALEHQLERDRVASGTDNDEIAYRAEMTRRLEEDAEERAREEARVDNGRPRDITA